MEQEGEVRRACTGVISVVLDPSSPVVRQAVALVTHRESSLPGGRTVELFEWPSERAQSIISLAGLQAGDVVGRLIARLPTGLVLRNVEENPMQLIFEMEYLALVLLPEVCWRQEVDAQYLAPLRTVFRSFGSREARAGRWWRAPAAVSAIGAMLDGIGHAVLDDFLPESVAEELERSILSSRHDLRPGRWVRGWWHTQFMGDDPSMIERFTRPAGGDQVLFATDTWEGHQYLDGCKEYERLADELVMALQQCPGKVGQLLAHTHFCHPAMFSIYPGDGTRYMRHCDNAQNKTGRRLTLIIYLNRDRMPSDGGQLRIYNGSGFTIKEDVVPTFNRVVVFWSGEENPHEVLPTWRERFAVSLWYFCGREAIKSQGPFKEVVTSMRVTGARARSTALPSCAETLEQRRRLEELSGSVELSVGEARERDETLAALSTSFAGVHESRWWSLASLFGWDQKEQEANDHQKVASDERSRQRLHWEQLSADSIPPCRQCGITSARGRVGVGEFSGQWFCNDCWTAWPGSTAVAKESDWSLEAPSTQERLPNTGTMGLTRCGHAGIEMQALNKPCHREVLEWASGIGGCSQAVRADEVLDLAAPGRAWVVTD